MRLIDHGENLIPFATEIALSLKRLLSLFLALSYLALEYALNFFGGKRCDISGKGARKFLDSVAVRSHYLQ